MSSSPEQQKSSSSSDSSSEKSTPPTSPDIPEALPAPRPIAHYSSTPPRRGGRHSFNSPATNRLGKIDEESQNIAPDIPKRNPSRPKKTVRFLPPDAKRFFSFASYSRPEEDVPPRDFYEKIVGPNGEKFSDLRQNKPFSPEGRGRKKRRWICLGLLGLVVLAIALGVGLGVGLTRHKGNNSSSNSNSNSPVPANNNSTQSQDFPIGTWAIPQYLTTTNTSCTNISSTWSCYPGFTYSQSSTSSFSTLQWRITSPTSSTLDLQISNTNPTFSYPFTDVPLNLDNTGDTTSSAFTFSFTYRKEVIPSTDITGDNSATRCYYNGTMVTARLYRYAQGGSGNVTGPPTGTTVNNAWPYAIEIAEMIGEGPQCYTYDNGVLGDQVQVAAADGGCGCNYRNFDLS